MKRVRRQERREFRVKREDRIEVRKKKRNEERREKKKMSENSSLTNCLSSLIEAREEIRK